MTTAPLACTRSFGAIGNTSFQVPAAAHVSSYCNRSGSMKMRKVVLWPNGGTPHLSLETYWMICSTSWDSFSGIPRTLIISLRL